MLSILFHLGSNLVRLLLAPFFYLGRFAMRPRSRWVHVRLRPRLVEIEPVLPFFAEWVPWISRARPTSLSLIRDLFDVVARDARMEGVVIDLPSLEAGWASCQSLRAAILALRARGKRVVVYLSEGGGNREIYVATAADRILATPGTQLAPLGLAASVMHFRGLLDKVGLEVEVHRRAEYKTMAEPATHSSMSEEQREQTKAYLETVDGELRSALAQRLGAEAVDGIFETALFSTEQALERRLLDGACYEDDLPTWITEDRALTMLVRAPRYYTWATARLLRPVLPQRYIAVVPIHGTISGSMSSASGAKLAGTVATLRAARRDPQVAGVVLHVDSPGGSATASDLIYREVERLKELKPVVACFGETAASGGYYVSACADAVVAQPMTMTGSIGVASVRVLTQPLLDRLGVTVTTLCTAPHADMLQRTTRLGEAEDAILEREIDVFYKTFVGLVARGRGRSFEDVEPLARGRVWSGADAAARGLVDQLGGLDAAVEQARSRVKGLTDEARAKLRPRVLRGLRLELPPAEPRRVAEEAALAWVRALHPRSADLLTLARGGDRVLCYALDLPTVR